MARWFDTFTDDKGRKWQVTMRDSVGGIGWTHYSCCILPQNHDAEPDRVVQESARRVAFKWIEDDSDRSGNAGYIAGFSWTGDIAGILVMRCRDGDGDPLPAVDAGAICVPSMDV